MPSGFSALLANQHALDHTTLYTASVSIDRLQHWCIAEQIPSWCRATLLRADQTNSVQLFHCLYTHKYKRLPGGRSCSNSFLAFTNACPYPCPFLLYRRRSFLLPFRPCCRRPFRPFRPCCRRPFLLLPFRPCCRPLNSIFVGRERKILKCERKLCSKQSVIYIR